MVLNMHAHARRQTPRGLALAVALSMIVALLVGTAPKAEAACSGTAVACENQLPGTPASVWDVDGPGDDSIQGYATQTSVNAGSSIDFKIDTDARAYTIKIYRLGYYQGNGAREVATINPSVSLPQNQPACAADPNTEIYDCGTWSVSASWNVPSAAVSGVYIARLIRTDDGGDSHIPFVVRNDGNTSAVLFQTSDSTWQAYNTYGGSSFYSGKANGRAYKLSYNRPYSTRGLNQGRDFLFSNEYPMLRFLEQNGYDVSYVSGQDVAADPSLLPKHKAFMSVGHDEYWTKEQRKNVTDARDAGVNLAFFSGNDVYWKTRLEPSEDGRNSTNRTLVDYKDTWAGADIDPVEPTATWRDPSFGDLGYGYGPENALIGTQYQAQSFDTAMKVSSAEGKLRLWRGTSLSTMAAGTTATLSDHVIGYESNEDVDNGYRPAGLIHLSTTTAAAPEYLIDYGNTVVPANTTHHLTTYRAASGALVFSAGTIQWSWGLDANHDGTATVTDPRMRQATANILADMGASATTLASDLTPTSKSTDTTPPTSTISAPAAGSTIPQGTQVTVTGTASDVGGSVAGIEVSVDAGASWHAADGTTSWSYTGVLNGNGASAIQARATDDSAQMQTTPTSLAVTSPCPCSIFGAASPKLVDAQDGSDTTLGTQFTSSADGYISGIRFYKAAGNAGTHTGTLYSSSGAVLATGTFSNETSSGWQSLSFASPVPITAGTTYTAAYRAPQGHYSGDQYYFASSHAARVLTALGGHGVANGVYALGSGFPTSTFRQTNYYVDATYTPTDDAPVTVTSVSPLSGATSVATTALAKATFSKDIPASSITMQITDPSGTPVPGSMTYSSSTRSATFNPTQGLANSTAYTVTVNVTGMGVPVQWSFTTVAADGTPNVCPCTLFNESDQPTTGPDSDASSVQLGMAFTVANQGQITGIRFYKNPENGGVHTVAVWNGSTKLGTATVTNETPTGWQEADFNSPVSVSAGVTYIASYTATQGHYAYTPGGLSSKLSKGPISSVANGGRYVYGAGALTQTSSANYFVDPVYSPAASTAPTVRATSPGANATSVALDDHIQATFSTPVQAGTAVVSLRRTSDGTDVPGTTSSEAQGSTVTFVPANTLDPATKYTMSVSGAKTSDGVAMTATYTSSFTTSGAAACPCSLMETSTQPVQDDSNDGAAVTVGLKFTPSVSGYIKGLRYYRSDANTGSHTGTLYSSTGTKLAGLTFTDSGTGWQSATFSTSVPVSAGTTYVAAYYAPNGHYSADLNYFSGAVVNTPLAAVDPGSVYVYGNGFPNQTYMNTNYYVDVMFATSDDDPPTVTAVTPTDGATGVPTGTAVTATFARDITESSLSVTLADPSGQLVGGQQSYDASAKTVTFTTAAPLTSGVVYTATASANSASGVAMTSPKTWTFTTVDSTPPAVTTTTPTDGSSGVAVTTKPSAVFDRDLTPSSVQMTLTNAAGAAVGGTTSYVAATRTATFTPTASLSSLTTYTATATAANSSGTPMSTPKSWTFATADDTPVITSTTPANGATGSAATTKPTAVFDRAITTGSLVMTLKTAAGVNVAGTTSYIATTRTATFTPSAALPGLTTYTASVTAASTAGAAMTVPKTWSFTTADTDQPTITVTGPTAGASGVLATTKVTATFAKPITASTLVMGLKNSAGTTIAGSAVYDAPSLTATFTPAAALTSSTVYTASVRASSASGVAMAAAKTWTFTTAAQTFSLYQTTQTPQTVASTVTTPNTVGVRFSSSRAGKVTAVRYYAASTNTGNTVGLWSSTGTRLGTATTSQTGTGWRTATFSTPIAITAGTAYVASYYAPVGRYSTTTSAFTASYTSGPLTVPTSGGRTGSGTAFPTTTTTTNLWVDVLVLI